MLRSLKIMKSKRASVLIEVLAAVAIMSVSLIMIMQSFHSQYKATALTQDYSKALLLLENRVGHALRSNLNDKPPSPQEPCPAPFERYVCKTKIDKLRTGPLDGVSLLALSVAWPAGKKERSVEAGIFVKGLDVEQKTTTRAGN